MVTFTLRYATIFGWAAIVAGQSTSSSDSYTGLLAFTTTTVIASNASHTQATYPIPTGDTCGSWNLTDGICCPTYCTNDDTSTDCSGANCTCGSPPSSDCMSGTMYGEERAITTNEDWHYSVSVSLSFKPAAFGIS